MAMRRACERIVSRALERVFRRASDGRRDADEDADVVADDASSASNVSSRATPLDVRLRAGALEIVDAEVNAEVLMSWAPRGVVDRGFDLVSGKVGRALGKIPWEAIGRESCSLEIRDVELVVRVGEETIREMDEENGETPPSSKGSRVVQRAMDVLFRGLKARAREVAVVVQDAAGVGKFLVRLEAVEYTHGRGVVFEGLSVRRISTGAGCSISESMVSDIAGRARVPSSSGEALEIELDEIKSSVSVQAMQSLIEVFGSRGSSGGTRPRAATASRMRRSFIDDVLRDEADSANLEASVYEEANEDMFQSAHEDSEEAYFDADEVVRELSESMHFGEDEDEDVPDLTERGVVIRCPKLTVAAPFDCVTCQLSVTSVEIESRESMRVFWSAMRGIYAFDDVNELCVRVEPPCDGGRCWLDLHESRADLHLGHLGLRVNGFDCLEPVGASDEINASIYWLADLTTPLDGSLAARCVREVGSVAQASAEENDDSLREHLANDASLLVKVAARDIRFRASADVLEAVAVIVQSLYELPDHHPLALRQPAPESVLSPIVLAMEVDNFDIHLLEPTAHLGQSSGGAVPVVCGLTDFQCFIATNVSGMIGSDFVWTQFARGTVSANGEEAMALDASEGSKYSSFAFARTEGETSCMDLGVVGACVSVAQCEPVIERVNTFVSEKDRDDTSASSDRLHYTLRFVDLSLVAKSNGSFGVMRTDLLRMSPKHSQDDTCVATATEICCVGVDCYVAPPASVCGLGVRSLPAYPFSSESLRANRFAPVLNSKAISLSTVSTNSSTAIASIHIQACVATLQKDTVHALRRLVTNDIESFDRPATPPSGDENEYVFVSPVKKARDIFHARYRSDVTTEEISDATNDDTMFPAHSQRGKSRTRDGSSSNAPLQRKSARGDGAVGPNVIENFFYRNNRRAKKKRAKPLFASGSVSSVRHSSSRVRTSSGENSLSASRFMGEFPFVLPIMPDIQDEIQSSLNAVQTRYLPLPTDSVIPQSTLHINNTAMELHLLPGLYWSESELRSPLHADSVEHDPLGSSAGVKLVAQTSSVRIDVFPTEDCEAAQRMALSIRDVTCSDITKGATWPSVIKYDSLTATRAEAVDMVNVDLTAVRPNTSEPSELEYVLKASALPVHLKLDQRVLKLVLDVFADETDTSYSVSAPPEDTAYFQKIEVGKLSLRFEYCGRQVDIDALRAGNLLEALNLVPWDGVRLDIQPIRLTGILGVGSMIELAIKSWLEDVTQTQAHKFVEGVKPIRSATKLGRGAMGLVSKPLEFHRGKKRGGVMAGLAVGVASFVKEVSLASIELGAFAAGQSSSLLAAAEGMISDARDGETAGEPSEPNSMLEGLSLATKDVWSGVNRAARAVVVDPLKEYAAGETTSSEAVLAAMKKVPYATVTGAKGVTRALDHALTGAKNTFKKTSSSSTSETPSA
jgi:autophagy-related protein 2